MFIKKIGKNYKSFIIIQMIKITIILFLGYFLIFEIYSKDEESLDVRLDDIPKKINFSFITEEHSLVGIVNYKSPVKYTRQSNEDIGHYTALCHRKNKKWIQYDDCKDSETILNDKYVACPHLILYSL